MGMSQAGRSHGLRLQHLERQKRPWKPDRKYDGFEGKGKERLCKVVWNYENPYSSPSLVKLYALLGLHRYNFLEGKNYGLSHIEKYYMSPLLCETLYITCVAMDPANNSSLYFLIKIDERQYGILDVTCSIAEPRDGPKTESVSRCDFRRTLPEWPSDDSFSDTKRFYVVNKSELHDGANDWIHLYLDLAIAATFPDSLVYKDLEIVDVAIESTQDPSEGLNAKNATVYIRFKDPSEARVGKEVDRVAMVRRSYDEESGWFNLTGYSKSSSETEPTEAFARMAKARRDYDDERFNLRGGQNEFSSETRPTEHAKSRRVQLLSLRPRFARFKPWRLPSVVRRKAFRNRGLHKTRSI